MRIVSIDFIQRMPVIEIVVQVEGLISKQRLSLLIIGVAIVRVDEDVIENRGD